MAAWTLVKILGYTLVNWLDPIVIDIEGKQLQK